MKKLLLLLCMACSSSFGQTFPVNNLQVNGASSFTGIATFTIPIAVSSGGTGVGVAGGTALDNITGFASTGFLTRTGAGAYTFQVAPSCSSSSNALQWTGAAFACNSAIVASSATTSTTQSLGNNTVNIATTAFVSNRGPCANIMDFGGNNAGVVSNNAAFTSALGAASNLSNNKCIYFPPGQYAFASQAGFTFTAGYQSVTLVGAGQDATQLYWSSGAGLLFSYNTGTDSVHIKDMALTTGSINAGSGIILANSFASSSSAALNTIQNVTIRDVNGYFGPNYFTNAILIQGISQVNMDGLNIAGPSGSPAGIGVNLTTTSSSVVPIIFNISNSGFYNLNIGLNYGQYVQGVQVINSNFTNDNKGIFVDTGLAGMDQLTVSNNQFNAFTNGFNIYALSAVPNVNISNNTFLINNNSSGVNLQATSTTTITGNTFEPNTGSPSNVFGVILNGKVIGASMISGNNFFNLTGGVTLQSGSGNVNVQSNVYNSCVTNTSNAGTGNVIGGGSP